MGRAAASSLPSMSSSALTVTDSPFYLPYHLDVRPSQEFSPASAKNKIVALDISSTHEHRLQFLVPHNGMMSADELDAENVGFTLQEGKLLHMSSSVDMENSITVGCAGAVLTYLQRRRATEPNLGDEGSDAFRVRSVEMFGLKGTM